MRRTQPFARTDSSYRRTLDRCVVVILCHNASVMRVHYHRYERGAANMVEDYHWRPMTVHLSNGQDYGCTTLGQTRSGKARAAGK